MEHEMKILRTAGGHCGRGRSVVPAVWIVLLFLLALPAAGQDNSCKNLGEFPCSAQIDGQVLQNAPTLLKLQARVAQAGLPVGTGKIPKLFVKIVAVGADGVPEALCKEEFGNVMVENSVLNLEIGREMDCELDDVFAYESGLKLQLCMGNETTCQLLVPLVSTPYAIRASFARAAERAHRVDMAAQTHYAHRMSADRDLPERAVLGTGYFDFETPDQTHAAGLYDEQAFGGYEDSGFLQWTPIRNRKALTVHVSAKDHSTEALVPLEELVLASRLSRFEGSLEVNPVTAAGLAVKGKGIHVAGTTDVAGELLVTGDLKVTGDVEAEADMLLGGKLVVGSGLYVNGGTFSIQGASETNGLLTVGKTTSATGDIDVVGTAAVVGTVTAPGLVVEGMLTATGSLIAPTATVTEGAVVTGNTAAGEFQVSGASTVGGALAVSGAIESAGSVSFNGAVDFKGGTSSPGEKPDMRYVLYKDEVRPIAFGGLMGFASSVSTGAGFDGALNDLVDARFQVAESPPYACTVQREGALYTNTVSNSLMACTGGSWRAVGGLSGCGNSLLQPGENCDDGNILDGDGCSAVCRREPEAPPGALVITEIMKDPVAVADAVGEWFEILNVSDKSVDLQGFIIRDGGSDTHIIDDVEPLVIQPGAYLVLGNNKNPAVNGGVTVAYQYGSFSLDNTADKVILVAPDGTEGGVVVDAVSYDSVSFPNLPGRSLALDPAHLDADSNDDGATWCPEAMGLASGDYASPWELNSECVPGAICGDGIVEGIEQCDDTNLVGGDGCSASCMVEPGYACNGDPSVCAKVCGNGQLNPGETCDDGNNAIADGCSPSCGVEPGYACEGAPSVCSKLCGNGKVDAGEGCDDGNVAPDDGCTAACKVESSWSCVGTPSICSRVCENSGSYWGGHCYKYMGNSTKMVQSDAQWECQSLGGWLFTPQSLAESQYVYGMPGFNKTANIHLGVEYVGGLWVLVVNSENPSEEITWSNWASENPTGVGSCVYFAGAINQGSWHDSLCDVDRNVVCEWAW